METPSKRSRTVTWEDPLIVPGAAPGLSGLQLMREMIEGKLPPPPIAKLMNFKIAHVEEGKAVFEGEPDESLYNPIGVVHGGYAMTLLDSAMGVSIHTTLKPGERYTTLETKVNFVRPITLETGLVRCEGNVVYRGGTIGTAEGTLTAVNTGKLLAHGTTTCLIARSA